jgi:hypothetical protein
MHKRKIGEPVTELSTVEQFLSLFKLDRAYDNKNILDHLDIAALLLKNNSGEAGFALAQKIDNFVRNIRKILICHQQAQEFTGETRHKSCIVSLGKDATCDDVNRDERNEDDLWLGHIYWAIDAPTPYVAKDRWQKLWKEARNLGRTRRTALCKAVYLAHVAAHHSRKAYANGTALLKECLTQEIAVRRAEAMAYADAVGKDNEKEKRK